MSLCFSFNSVIKEPHTIMFKNKILRMREKKMIGFGGREEESTMK